MNRKLEQLQEEREDIELSHDEERKLDNLVDNQIDNLKLNAHYKSKLSDEEKVELLKSFLDDEVCFRAMKDTFHEKELIKYINDNLGIMVEKVGIKK